MGNELASIRPKSWKLCKFSSPEPDSEMLQYLSCSHIGDKTTCSKLSHKLQFKKKTYLRPSIGNTNMNVINHHFDTQIQACTNEENEKKIIFWDPIIET
jgi:hypothetical protein